MSAILKVDDEDLGNIFPTIASFSAFFSRSYLERMSYGNAGFPGRSRWVLQSPRQHLDL